MRLYLLGTHYRHPLDFTEERIAESARALARLRALVTEAERMAGRGTPAPGPDGGLLEDVAAHRARFEAAMDDDFNTPQALGVLFDLARVLHGAREQVAQGAIGGGAFLLGVGELVVLARVLGLLEGVRKEAAVDPQLKARIESIVYLRQEARRQRDFAEADRLRDELGRLGVTIEDTPGRDDLEAHVVTRDMPPRQSPPDDSPPLFGRNPVLELLRAGSRRVEEIAIISEGRGPALHELLALAKRAGREDLLPHPRPAHRDGGRRPPPGGGGSGRGRQLRGARRSTRDPGRSAGSRRSSWPWTRCRILGTSGRCSAPRRPPARTGSSCPSTTPRA